MYKKNTEKNNEMIGYDKTISIATMTYKEGGNGASDDSLLGYKVLRLGDLAFEGHTNKEFRYGRFVLNDIGNGIMSPRFTTLRPINDMPINFWKYYIHYEPIMRRILVNSTKAGTMMNELVVSEFLNQAILVPSVDEQGKIGDYFSNLDNLITLHQRKDLFVSCYIHTWEQRKVSDIATFINGRAYSQPELLSEGKYKVLRVGNFYTNDSWYYSDLELDDKYYANEGDLLYTWSATFGPHIWHGERVIYHYHIWKVELTPYFDKSFAVQLFEYDKAKIISDKNGSTMVHITKAGIENKEFMIPSIEEQKKIGKYLDDIDNLITLHRRIILFTYRRTYKCQQRKTKYYFVIIINNGFLFTKKEPFGL